MKKKTILQVLAICISAPLLLMNCDSNNSADPELEAILLQSSVIDGFTVELLTDAALETGYNTLYWRVSQDGEAVEISTFEVTPIMHMAQMDHACPYNNPEKMDEFEGVYESMAIFIMPSGEMGSWEIMFDITTSNDEVISGAFDVDISSSWKLTSVRPEDGSVYFITWYAPNDPAVGNQDLSFMVHERETMMSFPAVSDIGIDVYPYMDMGGGQGHSTPFENPVAQGSGMYTGSINYSMSGTWTTTVELIVGTDTLDAVTFEYSVKAQ